MKKLLIIVSLVSTIAHAQSGQSPATIQKQVWNLTEVMYHDVVNPPAAARFYAYALLSGLEVLSLLDTSLKSFHQVLNDYAPIRIPVYNINKDLATPKPKLRGLPLIPTLLLISLNCPFSFWYNLSAARLS